MVGGDGFDVIMFGRVVGWLVEVERIVLSYLLFFDSGFFIFLVKKVFGEEEIKVIGLNVVGVVL